MGRPKKPTGTLKSIAECNDAMYRMLEFTIARERLIAQRDAAVAMVQTSYEKPLDNTASDIADIRAQLQAYYMSHLDEVELDGKRSIQLSYGIMGRRWSPPALALLNKSWKWDAVIVKLRALFAGKYFHPPGEPKPDKDLIKSELTEEQLRECGLKIAQEEEFYVEPTRLPEPTA